MHEERASEMKKLKIDFIGMVVLAVMVMMIGGGVVYGEQRYVITDLKDVGGIGFLNARGINNAGDIIGEIDDEENGKYEAVIWRRGVGVMKVMPLEGEEEGCFAYGINNNGEVTGVSGGYAVKWDSDGQIMALDSMDDLGTPMCINDNGQIVGSYDAGFYKHAFVWDSVNGMQRLLVDDDESEANGINVQGQIVGNITIDGSPRSFFYDSTSGMELIDEDYEGLLSSYAFDINDNTQAVGAIRISTSTELYTHAYIWTDEDGMVDIGALPYEIRNEYAQAWAINNNGEVVGHSSTDTSDHAFVWDSDNGMCDLNNLIGEIGEKWILSNAFDINDSGMIVGWGHYDPDGPGGSEYGYEARGFLLTLVPEPSILVMMVIGGVGLMRRKWCRGGTPII